MRVCTGGRAGRVEPTFEDVGVSLDKDGFVKILSSKGEIDRTFCFKNLIDYTGNELHVEDVDYALGILNGIIAELYNLKRVDIKIRYKLAINETSNIPDEDLIKFIRDMGATLDYYKDGYDLIEKAQKQLRLNKHIIEKQKELYKGAINKHIEWQDKIDECRELGAIVENGFLKKGREIITRLDTPVNIDLNIQHMYEFLKRETLG